jgi:hypothetical protein
MSGGFPDSRKGGMKAVPGAFFSCIQCKQRLNKRFSYEEPTLCEMSTRARELMHHYGELFGWYGEGMFCSETCAAEHSRDLLKNPPPREKANNLMYCIFVELSGRTFVEEMLSQHCAPVLFRYKPEPLKAWVEEPMNPRHTDQANITKFERDKEARVIRKGAPAIDLLIYLEI